MSTTFDPNLFTEIARDSGALTILAVIVHSFGEPGEYRGTVRREEKTVATFYVSVDKACAVADTKIDLAKLASPTSDAGGCCPAGDGPRFVVHPKGYAVFHVSSGAGGYAVNVRRADDNPEVKAYDSRVLEPGDIFSTVLMRPGRYAIRNELSGAEAEVTVAYPVVGKVPYKPPPAQEVELGETIDPRRIQLQPVQGLNFRVDAPARIRIDLLEADDGPGPAAG